MALVVASTLLRCGGYVEGKTCFHNVVRYLGSRSGTAYLRIVSIGSGEPFFSGAVFPSMQGDDCR